MKQPIPTCAVNLETLERKYFPSFIAASVHTGVGKEQVAKCFHQDTPFNGWYFCAQGDVDAKTERIKYLSRRWKADGMPVRRKAASDPSKLVSLRIDSHTVIMVPPYKATEEYAQRYREKLNKRTFKTNNYQS